MNRPQSSTADTPELRQLEELIGPRCETPDYIDFPNLKPDERCGSCEIWDAVDALIESEVRRARLDEARQITRLMPATPIFNEFIARKLVKRLAELEAGSGEAAQ